MLHGAAARALEVQYADGLEEDVDDAAAGAGERAIAETTQAGDVPTLGKAHDVLARSGVWSGELHQSVAEGRRVGAILEGTAERWWLGLARQGVAFGLGFPEAFHSAPEGAARTRPPDPAFAHLPTPAPQRPRSRLTADPAGRVPGPLGRPSGGPRRTIRHCAPVGARWARGEAGGHPGWRPAAAGRSPTGECREDSRLRGISKVALSDPGRPRASRPTG
jgi:hypothetical protein